MAHQAQEPVLIAVELGAQWPRWMSDLVRKSPRRVVAQDEGEASESFAARVAQVARAVGSLGSAVVLCNERADSRQDAARRELARQVLPELASGRGRLLLTAPETASERLQAALTALTRDEEMGPKAPTVRIGERAVASRPRSARRLAKVA